MRVLHHLGFKSESSPTPTTPNNQGKALVGARLPSIKTLPSGAGMLVGLTAGITGVGTLVGAGPETLAGDGVTHTTVGAGEDIGTVPTTEEDIMEEIMLICLAEEVMLRVFQEPLYHQEQMPIQVGSEIIAVVPIEQ